MGRSVAYESFAGMNVELRMEQVSTSWVLMSTCRFRIRKKGDACVPHELYDFRL